MFRLDGASYHVMLKLNYLMNTESDWSPMSWSKLQKVQQPVYTDSKKCEEVIEKITQIPPPLTLQEIQQCKQELAKVTRGEKYLLQIGDCAEVFDECTEVHWKSKLEFYDQMGKILNAVVLGRFCGQFAKPRSQMYEADGTYNYRGDLINGLSQNLRDPDPSRMLLGAQLACQGLESVKRIRKNVWTSHECLHLLYESCFVRNESEKYYLGNVHFPWLGDRTRSSEQAHSNFLRGLENPIGFKVGVGINVHEFARLVRLLNPRNEEGKLFAITRLGLQKIGMLRELVQAKQAEKLCVTFVCDPMHGNTEVQNGWKTRRLEKIKGELSQFVAILKEAKEVVGGLHLEATPYEVRECIQGEEEVDGMGYSSACDPRLNGAQSQEIVKYFAELMG